MYVYTGERKDTVSGRFSARFTNRAKRKVVAYGKRRVRGPDRLETRHTGICLRACSALSQTRSAFKAVVYVHRFFPLRSAVSYLIARSILPVNGLLVRTRRSGRDAKEPRNRVPGRDNTTRDVRGSNVNATRHTRHEHRSLATCGIELVAQRLRLPTGWPRSYENARVRASSAELDRSLTIYDGPP